MLVAYWDFGNGIRFVVDKADNDINSVVIETSLDELSDTHWSLMLMADPNRQTINNYLPACRVFTMVQEGAVIATALLFGSSKSMTPRLQSCVKARASEFALSADDAEIVNIAVAEDFQGRGLGKDLIEYCIQVARKSRYKKLWIATANSSLSQMGLYQKMGFRMDHIIPSYFADYPQAIVENGIQCVDMVRLQRAL